MKLKKTAPKNFNRAAATQTIQERVLAQRIQDLTGILESTRQWLNLANQDRDALKAANEKLRHKGAAAIEILRAGREKVFQLKRSNASHGDLILQGLFTIEDALNQLD